MMKRLLAMGMLIAVMIAANGGQVRAANVPKPVNAKKFDSAANAALDAMKKRAAELKVSGVAVVSFAGTERSRTPHQSG